MKEPKIESASKLLEELIRIQERTVKDYESWMGDERYQYKQEAKHVLNWLKSWRTRVTKSTEES